RPRPRPPARRRGPCQRSGAPVEAPRRGARDLARRAARGARVRVVRAAGDRAPARAAADARGGARRGGARARPPRRARCRARGARPLGAAARAAARPADARPLPLGPAGGRARGLPAGPPGARGRARARAEPAPPAAPDGDPPPGAAAARGRNDARPRPFRGGRRRASGGSRHDRRRRGRRAARGRARAPVRARARRAAARVAGDRDAERPRPALRHAPLAARAGRPARAAPPLPRDAAGTPARAGGEPAAPRHDRLRALARAGARGGRRGVRHRLLPRLGPVPRRLLPHRTRRPRDADRAPEHLRERARPRATSRRAPSPGPGRRLARAGLGELRRDGGRLHPLRRRRGQAAGRARRAAAPDAPAPARLHALRLDAPGRPRAGLRRGPARLSLVGGARGPGPARARVLAAARRRARRRVARGVRRRARARARPEDRMSARPASPFKGLSAFADTPLDAQLFFGREREREAIVANLLASRLTVLYGPSGVGKSSLLRAGVAQRLRTADGAAVVVHDSWVDDPVAGLVASIRAACPGLGPTAGLVDTLAAAAQAQGEAYLLLDQFEEYFLYHGADAP